MPTLRIVDTLKDVPAAAWDALHDGGNPFVSHAFLAGLETGGCVLPAHGWRPAHLLLEDAGQLRAAAPGYVKGNSHGEFVFDHAWAHAYARQGLEYYPKWLCAVPYSPCSGPRLLARDPGDREMLVAAMASLVSRANLSSAHVNFHRGDEDAAFPDDWPARLDIQYHWTNGGWRDFDAFLDAMDHRHRKNIRQERAKVARAGITLRVAHGDTLLPGDVAAMHRFYRRTFDERGNLPALTEGFFNHLAQAMPRALVLVLAERDATPIAGALFLRGGDTLHGRYWGADEHVPGLHFEACYYQGIEYCLREGLARFEPGAQGEHKLSRGFLPALVRSRHWIADVRFRDAIDRWCTEERAVVREHARRLADHGPFRRNVAAPA
ncbi:GNAT family N-acetyltransferase [Luteimonas pelagia]